MAVEIVLIIGMTAVFLAMIISWLILRAMEMKLKFRHRDDDDDDNDDYRHIKQKLDIVMEENEDIKEELRDIKYLLGDKEHKKSLDFDYEKEQIRIDKGNKFDY